MARWITPALLFIQGGLLQAAGNKSFLCSASSRNFLGFIYPVGVRMKKNSLDTSFDKNSIDTSFYRNSLDEGSLFDSEDDEEEGKEYQEFHKFLDEILGGYK